MENCEDITIDGRYVGDFLCRQIEKSIERIACNSIMEMNTIKEFAIEISKEANDTPYLPFGSVPMLSETCTKFDRLLKYNDITSIEFDLYDPYAENPDDTVVHYNYFVDWCGESEYENSAQKSYLSSLGNLYIVITKGIEDNPNIMFEQYFDKEVIEDEDSMSLKFEMYDMTSTEGENNSDTSFVKAIKDNDGQSAKEESLFEDDVKEVSASLIDEFKQKILNCSDMSSVDEILSNYGISSMGAKTAFLMAIFNLDLPEGDTVCERYEQILSYILKKD